LINSNPYIENVGDTEDDEVLSDTNISDEDGQIMSTRTITKQLILSPRPASSRLSAKIEQLNSN
jgi:hypothetical protein